MKWAEESTDKPSDGNDRGTGWGSGDNKLLTFIDSYGHTTNGSGDRGYEGYSNEYGREYKGYGCGYGSGCSLLKDQSDLDIDPYAIGGSGSGLYDGNDQYRANEQPYGSGRGYGIGKENGTGHG